MSFAGLERWITPEIREQSERFWAEVESAPEPEETIEEILDRNLYESLEDRGARLTRMLDLRLTGEAIRPGALDLDLGAVLFDTVTAEINEAAPGREISFDLVGLSPGSAVLHLRPCTPEDVPSDQQAPVTVDPVDRAMETVCRVHDVAEREGDLREFTGQGELLKRLHNLVKALDAHDVELQMLWRSATGRHRRSRLTQTGRRYVREQWQEAESEVREHTVSGRVVGLDLSGTFTVKPSSGAAKRIVHVEDPETLLGLRLQLGEWVHVRVHERHTTNRVGIESGVRYLLVGLDRPAGPDEDDLFS